MLCKFDSHLIQSLWGNKPHGFAFKNTDGKSGGLIAVWDTNKFTLQSKIEGDGYLAITGSSGSVTTGQATLLPHAFTTGTPYDPASGAWNFDTGASSHLNNSVNSLRENFNTFTTPSPIPHAFLVSQHTWHQRLGHPGGEVLRRLVSSNFISYNKEKHPILCHACQLGKHVRLSFVSSSTVISSCFDIIHSDVWTSPISSLLDDIPDIIPPVIPTNPIVQLPPEPITPIHNTPIQHHTDAAHLPTTPQQLSPDQVQTIENQAHSPPPSTSAVQQQTPTPTKSPTTQNEPVAQSPIINPDPPENPNPVSVHPMVTRFCVGTNRLTKHLNLHVSSVSSLPKSYRDAFSDPNWQNAMRDEYHALIKKKTCTLVPRPPDTNIVRCMWLFRHKYLADGTLSRYKARLVANGSTQLEGVYVDETFRDQYYLLLYVDDIVLTASFEILLQQIIRSLHKEFSMTDLCLLNYFLGISVTRDSSGLFLSQKKYAVEILDRAHMVNCNPSRTPIDTESKLGSDGDPASDPTLYQSLAGSLQYLTFTRPDISYAVQQACLYMHDLREPRFLAFKRILRYVRGTLDYGLQLFSSSTIDLVAYSDADWAGCLTTRSSTSAAEYHGVANAVVETCWLCNLLLAAGQVRDIHGLSRYQYAYIFTKGLPSALFEEFRSSLSVRCSPAPTAGEYIYPFTPLCGMRYTIMNSLGSKLSKLDRFLVSSHFVDLWPNSHALALVREFSDHSPIILCNSTTDFGPVPFKFYNSWIGLNDLKPIVQASWTTTRPRSSMLVTFKVKLQSLKVKLKDWRRGLIHTKNARATVLRDQLVTIDTKA
ncbi:ribonuclease H-like domain-containing protein [Tanacetum coccineum]